MPDDQPDTAYTRKQDELAKLIYRASELEQQRQGNRSSDPEWEPPRWQDASESERDAARAIARWHMGQRDEDQTRANAELKRNVDANWRASIHSLLTTEPAWAYPPAEEMVAKLADWGEGRYDAGLHAGQQLDRTPALTEAVRFYADHATWDGVALAGRPDAPIMQDRDGLVPGQKARHTLERL